MKLSELIRKVQSARKLAEFNLDDAPRTSRSGYETLKRQAQVDLAKLESELAQALVPKVLVGVFARGDSTSVTTLAETVRENGGLVLDAGKIWKQIAERVDPSIGAERIFHPTQHYLMVQCLSELCRDVNYPVVEMPEYVSGTVPDVTALQSYIRHKVRAATGDNLHRAHLTREIVSQVSRRPPEEVENRIPVVVLHAAEDEVPALAPLFTRYRVADLPAGFEPTEKAVNELFRK